MNTFGDNNGGCIAVIELNYCNNVHVWETQIQIDGSLDGILSLVVSFS